MSQLSDLWAQEQDFYVPGSEPSFGSIYSDMGAASQATNDWINIAKNGLGKVIDLELMTRYSPNQNQTPRQDTGAPAGTANGSISSMAPMLIGAALVIGLLFVALRK
jgi:hypothetical protein